jgi:hypothetical protein
MQLPGFLKRDPTAGPQFPEDPAGRGYATRGCIISCIAALFFWFIPIPVATIVWVFDLNGPFGDYMLMAIPFFFAVPIIGAGVAKLFGRRHRTNSCNR